MQHSVFCLIFKHYMGAILCFSGVLLSVVMGHLQYLVDSKEKHCESCPHYSMLLVKGHSSPFVPTGIHRIYDLN